MIIFSNFVRKFEQIQKLWPECGGGGGRELLEDLFSEVENRSIAEQIFG